MGIFDFFKGPQLKRHEASSIAWSFAESLFTGEITTEEFVRDADVMLENIFQRSFPNHSIDADQSRQILKLAYLIYENDKDWLEKIVRQKKYYENPLRDPRNLKINVRNPEVPNTDSIEYLTLFKY